MNFIQSEILKAIPNIKWYRWHTSYRLDLNKSSNRYIVFTDDEHIFYCSPSVSEITAAEAIKIIKLENFR